MIFNNIIKRTGSFIINIVLQLMCISYSLLVLIPVSWAFISSLRSSIDFFKNPFGIPTEFLYENFRDVWNEEWDKMGSFDQWL